MTAAIVGVRRQLADGHLPWVLTVSGLAVFGGDATRWRTAGDGSAMVDLEPPGAWYATVAHRWFGFGRGRHWWFWEPRRLTQ